jgi:hypothetical protein
MLLFLVPSYIKMNPSKIQIYQSVGRVMLVTFSFARPKSVGFLFVRRVKGYLRVSILNAF